MTEIPTTIRRPLLVLILLGSLILSSTRVALVQAELMDEAACNWGDEEGRKLCKEALHEMNGDTYLPSSNGSKDFVDYEDEEDEEHEYVENDGEEDEDEEYDDEEHEDEEHYNEEDEDEEHDDEENYGEEHEDEEYDDEEDEDEEHKIEENDDEEHEDEDHYNEEDEEQEHDAEEDEDEEHEIEDHEGEEHHDDEEHEKEDHEDDDDDEEEWNLRKQDKDWDVWKHGRNFDMNEALECSSYFSDFSDTSFENIHTVETWHTFNRIYNEVIAATKGTDLKQESTIPSTFDKHGFQFPIEIKFQPNVGRGVFAKTDIPKGSLLYLSTNNAAFFNGQTYRNFINALPPKLACDVTIWAFARWVSLETEENDVHMVCVDLDEGSFVNSSDDDSQYNMALGNDKGTLYQEAAEEERRELWYGCKLKFWAARDIKAGEEIRANYSDFAERDGWKFLTL